MLLAAILAVYLLYLLFWPPPIDPLAYQPPEPPPLSGPLQPNQDLDRAEILAQGEIYGPEDSDLDAAGRIYVSTQDGKIVRMDNDGNNRQTFAETGGRPLGIRFDRQGNLIVCDAYKGLLSISPSGEIEVLTTGVDGVAFRFTDDLDIASDGTIYFSDASSKYYQSHYLYDLMEARPHGRLLSYDRRTKETRLLMDGLYFANGVALSQDESFVLVNETYRYRIQRYWLKGKKAGSSDIFMNNLPGFPDNINRGSGSSFWLAMFTVRNPRLDKLHPTPFIKGIVSKLPRFLWPRPKPYGFVAEVSADGKFIRSFHEPEGSHLKEVTSVKEQGDWLYLGTLHAKQLARFRFR